MFILASRSPRRSELLRSVLSVPFTVIPADIDESEATYTDIEEASLSIALLKMEHMLKSYRSATILTADTTVIYNGRLLGKPHSDEEAFSMLDDLQGQTHLVVSGYAIAQNGSLVASGLERSLVTLGPMKDQDIRRYILTGSPFDKAGAYGIQDRDYIKVADLRGSLSNVMGLPVERLREEFIKLGL